jgi:hypothetical protein
VLVCPAHFIWLKLPVIDELWETRIDKGEQIGLQGNLNTLASLRKELKPIMYPNLCSKEPSPSGFIATNDLLLTKSQTEHPDEVIFEDIREFLHMLDLIDVQSGVSGITEGYALCKRKFKYFVQVMDPDSDKGDLIKLASWLLPEKDAVWVIDSKRAKDNKSILYLEHCYIDGDTEEKQVTYRDYDMKALDDMRSGLNLCQPEPHEKDAIEKFSRQFELARDLARTYERLFAAGLFNPDPDEDLQKFRFPEEEGAKCLLRDTAHDYAQKTIHQLVRANEESKKKLDAELAQLTQEDKKRIYSAEFEPQGLNFPIDDEEGWNSMFESKMRSVANSEARVYAREPIDLGEKLAQVRKELSEWQAHVAHMKKRYLYLNFLSLRQLGKLIRVLRKPKLVKANSSAESELRQLLTYCCWQHVHLNLPRAVAGAKLAQLTEPLELLEKCGAWLETTVRSGRMTARELKVVQPHHLAHDTQANKEERRSLGLPDKIHILSCSSGTEDEMYDIILSIYARCLPPRLPQHQQVLICGNHTMEEDLHSFVNRWEGSEAAETIFVLAKIEVLNYALQTVLIEDITCVQEKLGKERKKPNATLVLLSGAVNEPVKIFSRFEEYVASEYVALPRKVLTEMVGATLDIAAYSGEGKTFAIRRRSKNAGTKLLHIPIHTSKRVEFIGALQNLGGVGKLALGAKVEVRQDCDGVRSGAAVWLPAKVTRCRFNGTVDVKYAGSHELNVQTAVTSEFVRLAKIDNNEEASVLHLDLSSTCTAELSGALFELLFLGLLADTASGVQFAWLKKNSITTLLLELPDGTEVAAVTGLIPMVDCKVDANNFCAAEVLDEAVGHHTLMVETTASHVLGASAYQRVQYVCKAFKHLERGSFPRVFSLEEPDHQRLADEECFHILQRRLPSDVTAKARWAFVNTMYWQLQDLNNKKSLVHSFCDPDNFKPGFTNEQFKAKLVELLEKTANSMVVNKLYKENDPQLLEVRRDEMEKREKQEASKGRWVNRWV